ncbi:ATP-binding protein [Streptomyces sp. NPDC093225]|uniref:ATP-binding protein n=1 Tax=Streptomyces sp. NPDC093225 TaxID=3366034 RepID=UPI0037F26E57
MTHATELPSPELGGTYRMSITVGAHSARHIRAFLGSWELTELVEAAELALTELVANVVRHVPDRRCAVLILRRPEGLRVEVTDEHGTPALPVRGGDALADGGRGLLLVEAVTDRWGAEPRPIGKTVWFECDGTAGGGR